MNNFYNYPNLQNPNQGIPASQMQVNPFVNPIQPNWGSCYQANPYGRMGTMGTPMQEQSFKVPAPTARNIQGYLSMQLQIPVNLLEFVVLTEPFYSEGKIRHACKFSLLQIEHLQCSQLQYFDKASLDVAFCPNCLKVYYYIEKYN